MYEHFQSKKQQMDKVGWPDGLCSRLQEGHEIQATLNYEPEHKRKTLCFTQYLIYSGLPTDTPNDNTARPSIT